MTYKELQNMFRSYDAYLVGGAAREIVYAIEHEEFGTLLKAPKDFDVLIVNQIPPTLYGKWRDNSFGGRKYLDLKVDLWQDDIGRYLREVPRGKDGIAIHLETNTILYTREYLVAPEEKVSGRPVRLRKANDNTEASGSIT